MEIFFPSFFFFSFFSPGQFISRVGKMTIFLLIYFCFLCFFFHVGNKAWILTSSGEMFVSKTLALNKRYFFFPDRN